MPFINVSAGANVPDGWVDGVYPVILTDLSDPRTVLSQRGETAGQEVDLIDWHFAIESGQFENTEIKGSTSTNSGPRSKMYAWLTALFGKAPSIGTSLEKGDIIGRSALATIQRDDNGWLKVQNLSALPAGSNGQEATPAATTSGAAVPQSSLREEVTAESDRKIPF